MGDIAIVPCGSHSIVGRADSLAGALASGIVTVSVVLLGALGLA
jgi:hypothetical protein